MEMGIDVEASSITPPCTHPPPARRESIQARFVAVQDIGRDDQAFGHEGDGANGRQPMPDTWIIG